MSNLSPPQRANEPISQNVILKLCIELDQSHRFNIDSICVSCSCKNSLSFSFSFSFSSLILNFFDIYTVIYVPVANREQSRQISSKIFRLINPSFTISRSVCVCVCACAICGLRFPHQGEWRAEEQRKSDDDRSGSFYFLLQPLPMQPVTTQTPHPAQVNIYMGGISMRFPLMHTRTHTHILGFNLVTG